MKPLTIAPVYNDNEEKTISEILNRAQTVRFLIDYEIIAVDDCLSLILCE